MTHPPDTRPPTRQVSMRNMLAGAPAVLHLPPG